MPSFVRAEATLGRDSSGAGQRKANISMADVSVSPWRKHATRPSASIASFIEKVDLSCIAGQQGGEGQQ